MLEMAEKLKPISPAVSEDDIRHNKVLEQLQITMTPISLTFYGEKDQIYETAERMQPFPAGTVFKRSDEVVQRVPNRLYSYIQFPWGESFTCDMNLKGIKVNYLSWKERKQVRNTRGPNKRTTKKQAKLAKAQENAANVNVGADLVTQQ